MNASKVILPITFQNATQQYANNLTHNLNSNAVYAEAHNTYSIRATKTTTTFNIEEELDYSTTNEHPFNAISPKNSPTQSMNYLSEKYNRSQPYQNLSPIKPSFVNFKDEQPINSNNINHVQFGHSTPNHHFLNTSPKAKKMAPALKANPSEEAVLKKETIVKELAVNILELNNYRTRTEELDNKLKTFDQLKKEKTSSPDIYSINEKSEGIKNELSKLKAEMLHKIEDIHELEVELVNIEGHNTSSKINRQQINNLAHRNEEVMNEIKKLLNENRSTNATKGPNCHLTATKIIEEYSKEARMLDQEPGALQHNLQQRFEQIRTQIDNEYLFLKSRFKVIEEKMERGELQAFNMNINEIECLKTLIKSATEKYEREKHFLFKDFENDVYLSHLFAQQKNELEQCLLHNQNELQLLMRKLYSNLPGYAQKSAKKPEHETSFLTEEEEAIKKISQRIMTIKAKIDKRGNCESVSSCDEADNKELMYLNEQIKTIKSRMLIKGVELNKRKKSSNEAFLSSAHSFSHTSFENGNSYQQQQGPVYLPVNHVRQRNVSPGYAERNFKAEPVQVCVDSHSGSTNYFEHKVQRELAQQHREKKAFFAVDTVGANNFSCSPDRRYMSTIEIPAEQMEHLKKKHRSRSLSSSSCMSSESEYCKKERKNHRSTHHSQTRLTEKTVYINHKPPHRDPKGNLYTVSLKSKEHLKPPTPPNDFHNHHNQNQLEINFEQSQKEIESLKKHLTERNNLIERQRLDHELQQQQLFYLNENKINDLKGNENLLAQLESQQDLIINLRTKLNKLSNDGNLNSDTMSVISNSLNKVRKNVSENLKNLDNCASEVSIDEPSRAKKHANVSAQTFPVTPTKKSDPATLKKPEHDTTLVCNIPEHHKLEDMYHHNQEVLARLKSRNPNIAASHQFNYYTDDLVLLEKKAEFEALDLAINNRKQQLINLEFARNRRLHDSFMSDGNETFMKDELFCLEETLHRRNKELNKLESELKSAKKDLSHVKDTKIKIERDIEMLIKKNSMINKEMYIFDKKAEEATMDLLIVQEELDAARNAKKTLEQNISAMKFDLFGYLKSLKPDFKYSNGQTLEKILFGTSSTEYEMRYKLKELDCEIESRKQEINELKEKSQGLVKKFKSEMESHENDVAKTRHVHQTLADEINEMEVDLQEKRQMINEKSSMIESFEQSLQKMSDIKTDLEKRLEDTEEKLNEKNSELENIEKLLAKYMDNLESMRNDEVEMIKNLEKISSDICNEKENYDKLKNLINELMQNKNSMEAKVSSINQVIEKVSEEYEKREQQLIKLNNMTKEKQGLIKRDKEEIAELEYEKENINQETNLLKDKFRRKKIEFDRLEQNNKLVESQLNQNENELNSVIMRHNETKHQYDSLCGAVSEGEMKLKELINANQNGQQISEQLEKELAEKREECESLESYLEELRKESQEEKKAFNIVQSEQTKQRKIYDELKAKSKNCNRIIQNAENDIERLEEMQNDLIAKDKYINELENCIMDKNKELAVLNQSFLKNQEETNMFKSKLCDLEEQTKNQLAFESDLQDFLCNLEKDVASTEYLSDTKPPFKTNTTKTLLNTLLVTPSLRKAYSNNLVDILNPNQKVQSKENSYRMADMPVKILTTDKLNEKTNLIIEEQSRYKENILRKFSEKMTYLDKSKSQTKTSIDSLKSNLNEIEKLTANNIFKITSIKNC